MLFSVVCQDSYCTTLLDVRNVQKNSFVFFSWLFFFFSFFPNKCFEIKSHINSNTVSAPPLPKLFCNRRPSHCDISAVWLACLSLAASLHWRIGEPHYWPLACFVTLNRWCERCSTFSQLVERAETAGGYFPPFPHEWARRFRLASGLWGFLWLRLMIPLIIIYILSCVELDFIF